MSLRECQSSPSPYLRPLRAPLVESNKPTHPSVCVPAPPLQGERVELSQGHQGPGRPRARECTAHPSPPPTPSPYPRALTDTPLSFCVPLVPLRLLIERSPSPSPLQDLFEVGGCPRRRSDTRTRAPSRRAPKPQASYEQAAPRALLFDHIMFYPQTPAPLLSSLLLQQQQPHPHRRRWTFMSKRTSAWCCVASTR
jgi:hypothetical protein